MLGLPYPARRDLAPEMHSREPGRPLLLLPFFNHPAFWDQFSALGDC